MLHIYVPDVFKTFDRAIENGCDIIEKSMKILYQSWKGLAKKKQVKEYYENKTTNG